MGYIAKMFWPVRLSIFYPFPAQAHVAAAVIALLVLVAITVWVALSSRRRPYLLTGWLWYLGTLVPVVGLVQVGSQSMADRYTYLPLIGLFIIIAWTAAEVSSTWKHRSVALGGAAALVLTACVVLTSRQIAVWQNDRTLFTHAVEVNDQDYLSRTVLGDMFRREGDFEQATNYLNRAIELRPNSEVPWHGLGLALAALHKSDDAEKAFQTALQRSPADAHILTDYAWLLSDLGRLDEAEAELQKARQANPDLLEPRLGLVTIYQKGGRLNDAAKQCEEILQLDPANQPARVRLAAICSVLGQYDRAVLNYREAVRLNPTNYNARIGLGLALIESHDLAAAEAAFTMVLQSDSRNAAALDGLGFVLAQKGQFDAAGARFTESLQVDPKNPTTHLHYAMTLTAQGQAAAAVREYHSALELNGNFVIALNNLAWLLASHPDATVRNGAEAVTLAERAARLTGNGQPFVLGTLAAAYAEAGRFNEAIATAEKARDLASQAGIAELTERNKQLLLLYRDGKPYHEPPTVKY
jgi:tetratricopeptide (TPR) repeat protein